MRIALYDPDAGYFAAPELRSEKGGDFLTSPEVSPMFGESLAEFVRSEHDRIGDPFRLVEVAGGSGSLLRPLLDVYATVHVERDSQKAIVLGSGGSRLKGVGTTARHQIEALLGMRVYLDLHVTVSKDWQRDPKQLKKLGF